MPVPQVCMIPAESADRFWSHVTKDSHHSVNHVEGVCWLWKHLHHTGYGRFWARDRYWLAHRCAWTFTYGPIPPEMWVLHRCDNKQCVRPSHLELGTPRQNVDDALARGLYARGEQHAASKLTDAQVDDIRRLYATTRFSQRDLARRFNVSQVHICYITTGRTRSHR